MALNALWLLIFKEATAFWFAISTIDIFGMLYVNLKMLSSCHEE